MTLVQSELKKIYLGPNVAAMQGPCPTGFHVPSLSETTLLYNTFTGIGLSASNFTNYLKIPLAGYMNSSATVTDQGVTARIVTCTTRSDSDTRCMYLYTNGSTVGPDYNLYKGYYGYSIRPFKDEPVTLSLEDVIYYDPDTQYPIIPGYETLYWNNQFLDGVFRDETNGIITIGKDTGDPTATWITIADKNLGATTVFNTGDTLSESNSGKYYQRGNNYGFPGIGSSETITTSNTKIDTTGYGPGNYYTSSTYITTGQDWSNPSNNNLWGGQYTPIKKVIIRPNGQEKQIRPVINPIEAGIYHSATLGLITIADGNGNEITIADKNLGATQVYNDGDTLSEANCGKYFQRGNNYGFPRIGSVTTSSTKVDASTYGPGNYYSSSTFITTDGSDWSSVQNDNLWGGTTGTNAAMQGPAPTGYHVPSKAENVALVAAMTALGMDTSNGNCMKTYLKMPFAGNRYGSSAGVRAQGTDALYWSSTAYSSGSACSLYFDSAGLYPRSGDARSFGFSIRPFKNEVVAPDNTWTKLYEKAGPLCFTAEEANSTVALNKTGNPTAVELEISTDGTTWTDYTIGNTITLANVGDKVYIRNKSETNAGLSSSNGKYKFSMTGKIGASGDVTSLIRKNGYSFVHGWGFDSLFSGCTSLTTIPKLTATSVGNNGYSNMFNGCTSLTTLPKLPDTLVSTMSYAGMFYGCTNIKLSETQTGEYQIPYRIPTEGIGTAANFALEKMFTGTGGTFAGTPTINTTYYTSNTLV